MGVQSWQSFSVNMNTYTGILVLLLSLGANTQRRGGRAQSFRQGRDGSAAGDYSAPAGAADTGVASYGGAASDAANNPLAALSSSVPGVPGEDYPIYSEVPETGFACDGQVDGGYYADPEAECQVFHICTADGAGGLAKYSFLCPNGTLFNQNYFVCDWWFNFDCSTAEELYSLNDEIAAEREALSGQASDNVGSYQSPSGSDYDSPSADAYDAPLEASYDAPPAAYGGRTGRRLGGRRGGRRQE